MTPHTDDVKMTSEFGDVQCSLNAGYMTSHSIEQVGDALGFSRCHSHLKLPSLRSVLHSMMYLRKDLKTVLYMSGWPLDIRCDSMTGICSLKLDRVDSQEAADLLSTQYPIRRQSRGSLVAK